ncbi:hypothetical protein VZT92_000777 [Zoarces viviparus]|uniref:Uncharacterized protein n=1 Tax=Zoarces viviparus TaxID=48416 RepID=A0AAW1G6U7_ZOAVI
MKAGSGVAVCNKTCGQHRCQGELRRGERWCPSPTCPALPSVTGQEKSRGRGLSHSSRCHLDGPHSGTPSLCAPFRPRLNPLFSLRGAQ